MICQNADDLAFADDAHPTLANHSFKFAFKGGKANNAGLNLSQLFLSDGVGRCAGLCGVIGQAQKFLDRFERKAEFACMSNEGQSLDVRRFIDALVPRSPGRRRN